MFFLYFLAGILILFLVAYALLKKMQPKTPTTSTPTTQPKTKEYGWQVALIWAIPGLIATWILRDGIWAAAQSSPLMAGIFVLTLGVVFSWFFTMGRPADTEAANRFRKTMTIFLVIVGITLALLAQFGVIGGESTGGHASAEQTPPPPPALIKAGQIAWQNTLRTKGKLYNTNISLSVGSGVFLQNSGPGKVRVHWAEFDAELEPDQRYAINFVKNRPGATIQWELISGDSAHVSIGS